MNHNMLFYILYKSWLLSHNDWIKKEKLIFGMLHVSHNKSESELDCRVFFFLVTNFKDAPAQFFHREMTSQEMKWQRQQYKHVLHLSKWNSVYTKSSYRIPSDFLLQKRKQSIWTPQQNRHHHSTWKAKLTSDIWGDAGFNERIIVNEKEGRSGSNQTVEELLQISGTCWGVPADRQNQVPQESPT